MNDANKQIDELYDAWRAAFKRKDVDAILAMLTQDYLLWAPNTEQVGSGGLAPRLEAAFEAYDIEPSFQSEERIVSGGLAFERGWDIQHISPRAGGDPITQRQRVFMILRLQSDGRWLFARGMSQPGPAV